MRAQSASRRSELTGEVPSQPNKTRTGIELFLISFMILFFELAWIRWLGSTVIFLTFFTNIVLIACFLGVSVGCLAAFSAPIVDERTCTRLRLVTAASASGFLWAYNSFSQVVVEVGSQQSPQLIYFGTDARVRDPSKWVIPIELLAGYFFALVALVFVGPGQEMGRRFAAIDNRVGWPTPPIFAAAWPASRSSACCLISGCRPGPGFWSHWRSPCRSYVAGPCSMPRLGWPVLGLVALADRPNDSLGAPTEVIWSPYYQVRFKPRYLSIDVNNMGHQGMLPVDRVGPGLYSAASAQPRRRQQAVRRCAHHRRRLGQRRRRRAGATGRSRRRRRDRPGDQRAGQAPSSQPPVQRPAGLDPSGRRSQLRPQDLQHATI